MLHTQDLSLMDSCKCRPLSGHVTMWSDLQPCHVMSVIMLRLPAVPFFAQPRPVQFMSSPLPS